MSSPETQSQDAQQKKNENAQVYFIRINPHNNLNLTLTKLIILSKNITNLIKFEFLINNPQMGHLKILIKYILIRELTYIVINGLYWIKVYEIILPHTTQPFISHNTNKRIIIHINEINNELNNKLNNELHNELNTTIININRVFNYIHGYSILASYNKGKIK